MNLPDPRPDEDLCGLIGRIQRFNCFVDFKMTKQAIFQWHGQRFASTEKLPVFAELADLMGIDRTSFVVEHTTIPLLRAFHKSEFGIPHGEFDGRYMPRETGLKSLRAAAHFCRHCVHEDIDFWGESYWRRTHQLPFIDWCMKHQSPLLRVDTRNALSSLPEEYLKDCVDLDVASIDTARANPAVERFVRLVEGVLEREFPISTDFINIVLLGRAKELGLRLSSPGTRENLTDVAIKQLPSIWLLCVYPKLRARSQHEAFLPLENSIRRQCGPIGFLLAAALLFEDSEVALNSITRQPTTLVRGSQKKEPSQSPQWESREIDRVYADCKGDVSEIARRLGQHPTSTRDSLIRHALPPMSSRTPNMLEALLSFHDGESICEACRRWSVPQNDLEDLLRKSGPRLAKLAREIKTEQVPGSRNRSISKTASRRPRG